jgi:hypothetical protein
MIGVVALLVTHDDPVATRGRAGRAIGRALGLDLAFFRAAVERQGVAVVAALSVFHLAVATDGVFADAWSTAAPEAWLDFAGG